MQVAPNAVLFTSVIFLWQLNAFSPDALRNSRAVTGGTGLIAGSAEQPGTVGSDVWTKITEEVFFLFLHCYDK